MFRKLDSLKDLVLVPRPTYKRTSLTRIQYAQSSSVQLRDGDVVVIHHADSPVFQFLHRIKNGLWQIQ